ncbi:MAG: acyltransferase [Candidatus Methylarchaceae archaeon HK02M2]|nr:acyltransferase [Candidatus Methylarchaceae archaeon HK02M2]
MTNMSKLVSDFLKGLAIFSVLCNHYVNFYTSLKLSEFANGFIAVFFVLSGYGIYASLSKSSKSGELSLSRFYLKRFLRIYPLYFLSVSIFFFLETGEFNLYTFLAVPFVQAPGIYWFITSLLQCYIIAPFIYLLIVKLDKLRLLIISLLTLVATYMIYLHYGIGFTRANFVYRFVPLGHIYLFLGGMILYSIEKPVKTKIHILIALILFLSSVILTRNNSVLFDGSGMIFGLFLLVSSIYICYAFTSMLHNKLIFSGLICSLGMCSYSIYLFHVFYYKALVKANIIHVDSIVSVIITFLLLPVFVYLMSIMERAVSITSSRLLQKN